MYKVLIVDDEAIERQAMRQILTRGLREVEISGEAVNGREAVRLADELRPNIILMDIKMPGIDGIQAVKIIKRAQPEMKFVMVSAFDTFEYAREVMHEGVKEYLLKPTKKEEIINTVGRVIREIRFEKSRFETAASGYFNDSGNTSIGLLQEATQYINDHFHESVTLEDVAEQVDLSPYYFSKLFKEQNGATFIEYLTEVRIRRAKELLKTTRMSLKEICFEAGYHDPNYFSRVFKKSTGCSPSEYRSS